ncbi:unnamed protein product, partial [Urochloa humidicola]
EEGGDGARGGGRRERAAHGEEDDGGPHMHCAPRVHGRPLTPPLCHRPLQKRVAAGRHYKIVPGSSRKHHELLPPEPGGSADSSWHTAPPRRRQRNPHPRANGPLFPSRRVGEACATNLGDPGRPTLAASTAFPGGGSGRPTPVATSVSPIVPWSTGAELRPSSKQGERMPRPRAACFAGRQRIDVRWTSGTGWSSGELLFLCCDVLATFTASRCYDVPCLFHGISAMLCHALMLLTLMLVHG